MDSETASYLRRICTASSVCLLVLLAGTPASAQRVTNGVLVLYQFEEAAGIVVRDVSRAGEALDLTIVNPGAVAWIPGGGCSVNIATRMESAVPAAKIITACTNSNQITMEAWVKPANITQTGPARIATLSTDNTRRNFTLGQFENMYVARLRTTMTGDDGTNPEAFSDPGAATTNLTHVVGTRGAAGNAILYINGVEVAAGVLGGFMSNWDPTMKFAVVRELSGAFPWLGDIYLAAVYSRALSPAEVVQNYNAGTSQDYDNPPSVVTEPADVIVTEPAPATFAVSAAGDGPMFYQWRRNGAAIAGETDDSYMLIPTSEAGDDGAQFDVIVSNQLGVVTSRVASLTVNPLVPEAPGISQQPQDDTVMEPSPAAFDVTATGTAPLSYQWRRDGAAMPGATDRAYVLNPTSLADDGAQFDVIVSNLYGVVTSQVATLTVNPFVPEPPLVTIQPQSTQVTEPQAAAFGVAAQGTAPLHYQWRREGTPLVGETSDVLVVDPTSVAADDGARFDVIISNLYGVVTSLVATLTVNPDLPDPPVIAEEPVDMIATEPAAATFSAYATGDAPLSYQWRRNGVDIPGANGAAYSLFPTTAAVDDGAQFDVIVSNPYGAVTSLLVTLTVNEHVVVPAAITTQPADVTVTAPDPAAFTVTAVGDAPILYQWRRDGIDIPGADASSYTLDPTSVAADDGAQFDVYVRNAYGAETSVVATLTVNVAPQPPTITQHPSDLAVMEPSAAAFTVSVAGNSPLYYTWRRDGLAIPDGTNTTYVLDPTSVSDSSAEFDLIVSNAFGVATSLVATLTVTPYVTPPTVTLHPSDRTVTEPNLVIFSVRVLGDPPMFYQWRRNGTNIPGATAWDYTLLPTSTADNGAQFDATVSNSAAVVTSQVAVLTVNPSVQPPNITLQPANRTVTEPAAAIFSVRATGDPPMSYQWRRNGTDIPGATAWDYTLSPTENGADDGAQFDALVSNSGGVVTSDVTTLTVNRIPVPPSITLQPADVSVVESNAAVFTVAATGDAILLCQWRRDGATIAGATGTVYTLDPALLADNGAQFVVVVSNDTGVATSSVATLTVTDEPHKWRRPTLTWDEVPGATWYYLWINRNGANYHREWLNQTNTSWTASFDFTGGDYTWWVRGWGPVIGYAVWSSAQQFSLPVVVPGQATLQAPEGSIDTNSPVFTWDEEQSTYWYKLSVNRNGSAYRSIWLPWQNTSYTFPDPLPLARYEWWIRTWSPDGYGPWSDSKTFSLGRSAPLSPTGTVDTTRLPEFTWTPAGGATWYRVWLNRNGATYVTSWVEAQTTWTPSAELPTGDYTWWIQTWSPGGYGPWSDGAHFTIPLELPLEIVPVAPTGTVSQTTLEYKWEADENATWYYLYINDSGGKFHTAWYGTGIVTGEVAVTVSGHYSGGAYTWWLRGWGPDGYGPWNVGVNFDVTGN